MMKLFAFSLLLFALLGCCAEANFTFEQANRVLALIQQTDAEASKGVHLKDAFAKVKSIVPQNKVQLIKTLEQKMKKSSLRKNEELQKVVDTLNEKLGKLQDEAEPIVAAKQKLLFANKAAASKNEGDLNDSLASVSRARAEEDVAVGEGANSSKAAKDAKETEVDLKKPIEEKIGQLLEQKKPHVELAAALESVAGEIGSESGSLLEVRRCKGSTNQVSLASTHGSAIPQVTLSLIETDLKGKMGEKRKSDRRSLRKRQRLSSHGHAFLQLDAGGGDEPDPEAAAEAVEEAKEAADSPGLEVQSAGPPVTPQEQEVIDQAEGRVVPTNAESEPCTFETMETGRVLNEIWELHGAQITAMDEIDSQTTALNDELAAIEHDAAVALETATTMSNDAASAANAANADEELGTIAVHNAEANAEDLNAEHHTIDAGAEEQLKEINEQVCAIKKLRNSIVEKVGDMTISDCAVSSWYAGQCSSKCGGGIKKLNRDVMTPGENGVKCPILELQMSCNEHACPINATCSQWSDWGECSKKCGEGIQTRTRNTVHDEQNDGESCGETQSTRLCNTHACDADCVIGEFGEPSKCSAMCGTGYTMSVAPVLEPARGNGICPSERSPQRAVFEDCEAAHPSCPEDLNCAEPEDVLFVFDSSDDVDEKKRDAAIDILTHLVSRFTLLHRSSVAVISQGGYKTQSEYEGCVKNVEEGKSTWGPWGPCRTQIIKRWKGSNKDLGKKIINTPALGGATFPAAGLLRASELLSKGRVGRRKVVVLFLLGKPTIQSVTVQAANVVKEAGARLFVIAGDIIAEDKGFVHDIASAPWQHNSSFMKDLVFADEKDNEEFFANWIVSQTCEDAASVARRWYEPERGDDNDAELEEKNGD